MKTIRTLFTFVAAVAVCTNICACRQGGQQKAETKAEAKGKTLVAYFSATGTTARAAQQIAKETGGELYEITPAQPYTAADLDWNDKQSRSSVEMNDPKNRPALKAKKADIGSYDTVYLGYPIWWGRGSAYHQHVHREPQPARQARVAVCNVWRQRHRAQRRGAESRLSRHRLGRREDVLS